MRPIKRLLRRLRSNFGLPELPLRPHDTDDAVFAVLIQLGWVKNADFDDVRHLTVHRLEEPPWPTPEAIERFRSESTDHREKSRVKRYGVKTSVLRGALVEELFGSPDADTSHDPFKGEKV